MYERSAASVPGGRVGTPENLLVRYCSWSGLAPLSTAAAARVRLAPAVDAGETSAIASAIRIRWPGGKEHTDLGREILAIDEPDMARLVDDGGGGGVEEGRCIEIFAIDRCDLDLLLGGVAQLQEKRPNRSAQRRPQLPHARREFEPRGSVKHGLAQPSPHRILVHPPSRPGDLEAFPMLDAPIERP
jgi:hypothetical protein